MLSKLLFALKVFIALRVVEFTFVVLFLTSLLMLSDGIPSYEASLILDEHVGGIEDIIEVVLFWASFAGIYVILMGYATVSLVVFLIAEFTAGINRRNIPYLNSLPYMLHSLPILLGFVFVGEPAEIQLWFLWVLVIIFNFFSPRLLKSFREKAT